MSQRELLHLHAEVKAVQEQYGISYKDAAHRLYHAEIQKLSALADTEADIAAIHDELDHTISDVVKTGEE